MTKEDRQLLLVDLCSRLPYGVKGLALGGKIDSIKTLSPTEYPWVKTSSGLSCHLGNGQFKPYLRPMSSMTEDERNEIRDYVIIDEYKRIISDNEGIIKYINWLNRKMFDYRGLIEKGLAIKAPEDMY